tara:strand:+ start:1078 stop:4806 length:3729 start_codon:yes stop_codon:yes gene_type:complete
MSLFESYNLTNRKIKNENTEEKKSSTYKTLDEFIVNPPVEKIDNSNLFNSYNSNNRSIKSKQVEKTVAKKDIYNPPAYKTLGDNYSVTDFEQNPEVINDANKVLTSFGTNDNLVEWLRDSNISASSAVMRAFEANNVSDDVKQAYARLQSNFSKAKLKKPSEYMGLIKDGSIDIFADPLTIISLLAAPWTGGASAVALKAVDQAVKQGVKKYAVSQMVKTGARPAIFTGAEGAAWTGLHNYYNQDLDVNIGVRNNIDMKELLTTSTVGGALGLGLGFTTGALSGAQYFKRRYKYHNPDEQMKHADSVNRKDIVKEEELFDVELKSPYSFERIKDKFIGNTFGKATTPLASIAKSSKTLDAFLKHLRYDYNRTLFGSEKNSPVDPSYFEGINLGFGKRHFKMEQIFNDLGRTTSFKKFLQPRITREDNDALGALLRSGGKATKFKSGKRNNIDIPEDVRNAYEELRVILEETFDEGQSVGIFQAFQKVSNYFPRIFNYGKLDKGRQKFEELLIDKGYANTSNNVSGKKFQKYVDAKAVKEGKKVSDLEIELGVPADAKTIDQEAFNLQERFGVESFEDLALQKNPNLAADQVIDEARKLKARTIVDDMLRLRHTPFEFRMTGGVGSGKGFMQHRKFTKIDDEELAFVLEDDVTEVLTDYFTNVTSAIERTKRFGLTVGDFEKNFVSKIEEELIANSPGGSFNRDDITNILENVRKLHRRSTGLIVDDQASNLFSKGTQGFFKTASEWGRLSQQMAHLPLAVVSSITEPIIMLSRVGISDSPEAAGEIAKSMVKGVQKIFDRTTKNLYSVTTGKKVSFKDLDDEYWKELYEVGLALESATLDGFDRLASGDALTGTIAKGVQNAFFKVNFLTQWTQAVQAASFVTGQKLIRRNAQKLYEDSIGARTLSTGNFRNSGVNQKEYLTGQLNELGISSDDAIKWYRESLDEDKFFSTAKSEELDFYNKKYLPAAGRFVNEVILNPSVAAANKPLLFSSGPGKLLFQFAGYPTAFNNIVLKKFINDSKRYPLSASPKVLAASLMMTSVAMIGNYIRSEGRQFEEYRRGEKTEGEIIGDSVARWGGFGPLDYGRRIRQNAKYGSGMIGSTIKGVTGPLPADLVDNLLYRKGIFSTAATNVPGYGFILSPEIKKEWRSFNRDLDKALYRIIAGEESNDDGQSVLARYAKRTGGEITVPNAPNKAEQRVNKLTGMPYDIEAGPTAQREKERVGYSEEGKLLATMQRRKEKNV